MGMIRPAVATLLALALFGCGDDPPAKGCDAAHLDRDGTCSLGSVVGSVRLEVGDETMTTVSLAVATDEGGRTVEYYLGSGSGPFSFEGLAPGIRKLAVKAAGYLSHVADVPVTAGKTTDVGEIVLQPDPDRPATIEGIIRLAGATNHGGTLVRLDDSTLMVSTTSDGAFRFADVAPGAHVLHARHDGYEPLDLTIFLERGPNALEFTMERLAGEGTLSGTVIDSATSAPVEGATVTVGDTWAGTTGPDGAYAIEGIPSGIYQAKAGRSGYLFAVANGVSISADSVTRRDFALVAGDEPSKLYGVATRAHAAEGANGGISVRLSGTPIATETDALGRWRLEEAPDGRYDVVFSDPRFPSVTVRGVSVSEQRHTQVPDVTLGPAKKIVDGHSTSSRVFPIRRKAVVATTQGTYLFDAARSARTKLSDEALEVIAVDSEERYATLKGPGKLYRLDVAQGVLERIQSPAVKALVSDRALTLFVGEDLMLYALRAGETTLQAVSSVNSTGLWIESNLDEARGWRTVATSSFEMIVDFEGWVGPIGHQIVRGKLPGKVATVGRTAGQPGRTIFWSDIGARTSELVAERVVQYGFWDENSSGISRASTCLFSSEEGAARVLVIDTGTVTELVSSSEDPIYWVTDRSLITRAKGGREIRWVSSDPPSSGILCEDASADQPSGWSPYHFCLEGAAPYTLRTFVDGLGGQTWSQDAMGLPLEEDYGVYAWNGAGGLLHVRLQERPEVLSYECEASEATLSLIDFGHPRPVVQATCATQPGTFLLDFQSAEVRHLPAQAARCSVSPDGKLAACSHPCAEQSCFRLHDLDAGTSSDVSTSSDPRFVVVWGRDGGAAIRAGGGAFHVTTSGAAPQVASCGLAGAFPSTVSEGYSLWFDLAGQGIVCASDGTASDPFLPWSTGIARIGGSQRYFLGGYLVDLADGSVEHLVDDYGYEVPYPGGVLITSRFGLIRVPEAGAPTWLVEDDSIYYLFPLVPWTGFLVGDLAAFDLLVSDGAGNVATLLEDGVELVAAGGTALVFHDEGPDGTSLALIDPEVNMTLVPHRVAGPRQIEGNRIFFDTPMGDGLGFATARLDTGSSSILFPTSGGAAIGAGDDGRWIFGAEGWTWQENGAASRAVIAGESLRVQSASDGTIVFHAIAPDATYWLGSE